MDVWLGDFTWRCRSSNVSNGGNGASQAILDARGLVLSFREHGVTLEGLNAYDNLQRTATHPFILAGR